VYTYWISVDSGPCHNTSALCHLILFDNNNDSLKKIEIKQSKVSKSPELAVGVLGEDIQQ